MAELMLGQPLFPGESGIDQLVEIIKVLGTPTREQIRTMNPNYMEHKFPQIKPHPFTKVSSHRIAVPPTPRSTDARPRSVLPQVFRKAPPEAVDLITRLLEYTPTQRLSAIEALTHPFFDELRDPNTRLPDSRNPNGHVRDLPELFDFTRHGRSFTRPSPAVSRLGRGAAWWWWCWAIADAVFRVELSIAPELNRRLVPEHKRAALLARGIDLDNFEPMSKEDMMARID